MIRVAPVASMASLTLVSLLMITLLCDVTVDALKVANENCRIHWVAHNLRLEGCRDRRLLSLACKGLCQSHSVYVPEINDVHRTCSCCQATGSTIRRVRMVCYDDAIRRFRPRIIQVSLPTGCMCRPCSAITDRVPDMVNPVEDRTLADYLTL